MSAAGLFELLWVFPAPFRAEVRQSHDSTPGGLAIDALTLPQANGGAGTIRYRLTPAIPGLRFALGTRVLSGTPSAAGTYRLTYRATDERDLSATLQFTVTVIGEIGDSPATATLIRPGSPIRGRLQPGTGAHYFKVEVASPGRLIAATDRNPRYADTVVSIEGVPGHAEHLAVHRCGAGCCSRHLPRPGAARSRRLALVQRVRPCRMGSIEVRYVGERAPAATTETVIHNAVRRWERIIGENGATGGVIITASQVEVPGHRTSVRRLRRRPADLRLPPRTWMDPPGAGGPASCVRRKRMAHRGCRSWAPMGFDPKYLAAARDRSRARLRYPLGPLRLPAGPSRRCRFTGAGHALQRRTGHRRLRARRRRWVRAAPRSRSRTTPPATRAPQTSTGANRCSATS